MFWIKSIIYDLRYSCMKIHNDYVATIFQYTVGLLVNMICIYICGDIPSGNAPRMHRRRIRGIIPGEKVARIRGYILMRHLRTPQTETQLCLAL